MKIINEVIIKFGDQDNKDKKWESQINKWLKVLTLFFCVTMGYACYGQNRGSLLSTEDYFESFYSNGALVPDRNIKVSFYQNAVEIQYYSKGTRNLSGKPLVYFYDHTEANGDKVFYDNPNAWLKTKLVIMSDGTIKRFSSAINFMATKGFRDISSRGGGQSVGSGYNNGGNNTYNNQPSYVTCPACGGRGQDQGRIQYYPDGGSRYCATCGTTGMAHDHFYGQCGRCGGTGRVAQ